MSSASGQQWKATIRNAKVNLDEFGLAHVDDMEDATSYTRDEVLDYLRTNVPTVEWHILGEPEQITAADIERMQERLHDGRVEEAIDEAENYGNRAIELELELEDNQNGTWTAYGRDFESGEAEELGTWDDEETARRLGNDELEERNEKYQEQWRTDISNSVDWPTELEARRAIEDTRDEGELAHFSDYVMPGPAEPGSYREVLVTAPAGAGDAFDPSKLEIRRRRSDQLDRGKPVNRIPERLKRLGDVWVGGFP